MTVHGARARANLLVISYSTYSGLALMVLRRAAGLSIDPSDRAKPAFDTAGTILSAARRELTARSQVPQNV